VEDGRIQLVVPVYNEGAGIRDLFVALCASGAPFHDLAFVYDFDEDTTVPYIRELAARDTRVRGLKNDTGRGVVNALRHAFERCVPGPVVVMMGDCSDDLSILGAMIEAWRGGATIVCPSRYVKGGRQEGGGVVKSAMSRTAGKSLKMLGFPVADPTNNFKLYDGAWIANTPIESEGGFEVALELCVKAWREGRKFVEIPAMWRDRTQGQSKFRLMRWLPHYLRWYLKAVGALLNPFGRRR
jgi:dolichol-phosphate mannosyltransferase